METQTENKFFVIGLVVVLIVSIILSIVQVQFPLTEQGQLNTINEKCGTNYTDIGQFLTDDNAERMCQVQVQKLGDSLYAVKSFTFDTFS